MPNHSIEGMSSRLRRLATPHVKRWWNNQRNYRFRHLNQT